MFGRDKNKIDNEQILYEARPSFISNCTGVFVALIVLGILFYLYNLGIKFIGNMNTFLISSTKMPITSYYALTIFVLIIFVFLYIVWRIFSWNSVRYIITDYRVIVKKGIITENKTFMPYNTIQDINVSQNIIGRIISVGTLTLYSAYDGKDVELKDISSPNNVESMIIENMRNPRPIYDNSSAKSSVSGAVNSILNKFKVEDDYIPQEEYYPQNYGNIFEDEYPIATKSADGRIRVRNQT